MLDQHRSGQGPLKPAQPLEPAAPDSSRRETRFTAEVDNTALSAVARYLRRQGLPLLVLRSNRQNYLEAFNEADDAQRSIELLVPYLPDFTLEVTTRLARLPVVRSRLPKRRALITLTFTVLPTAFGFGRLLLVGLEGAAYVIRDMVRGSARLGLRSMPLILMVLVFLFFTHDAWGLFGDLSLERLISITGILVIGALIMLHAGLGPDRLLLYHYGLRERRPEESGRDMKAARVEELIDRVRNLVVAKPFLEANVTPSPRDIETNRLAQFNIAALLIGRVAAECLAMAGWVVIGFVFLGLATFRGEAQNQFLNGASHPLITVGPIVLSAELLRVSVVLGAIALFYFVAVSLHDDITREAYIGSVVSEIDVSLALYAFYRGAAALARKDAISVANEDKQAEVERLANALSAYVTLRSARQAEMQRLADDFYEYMELRRGQERVP